MISKDYKYQYIKTDAGQNVLNWKVLNVYAQFDKKNIVDEWMNTNLPDASSPFLNIM